MKSWVDKVRRAVASWWRRNVVAPDPYDVEASLPKQALFIVEGHLMNSEGLRMWAHYQMFPKSVRRQSWM